MHGFPGYGMTKGQFIGVEHLAPNSAFLGTNLPAGGILLIAEERVANGHEVPADLVRAPGFKLNLQMAGPLVGVQGPYQCPGAAMVNGVSNLLFRIRNKSADDGVVHLADPMLNE